MTFSDQDLKSFLDGTAPADISAAIEAALADDDALERRLMALDDLAGDVKAVMQQIPSAARLQGLSGAIKTPAPTSGRWRAVAASLVIGGVIGASVMGFWPAERGDWRAQVASYQALYVADTVAALDPAPELLQRQFQQASAAVGLPLSAAAVSAEPDLGLRRAQILGVNGKPLIQIVFATDDGTPVALCLIRKAGRASDVAVETHLGLASASWSSETHDFFLIGGRDEQAIRAWADGFQAAI